MLSPLSGVAKTIAFTVVFLFYIAVKRSLCEKDAHASSPLWPEKPNFIIMLADDMGLGDLASYGHPVQERNELDDMADEGMLFRQFYSGDCLCTPSRAALLTGRLPVRIGMVPQHGPLNARIPRVLMPIDTLGLPDSELTIAEALKPLGYTTGMVGKWHLGINAYSHDDGRHLPKNHGFDYVGTNFPWSNFWNCDESGIFMKDGPDPKYCFLYNESTIIQQPVNLNRVADMLVDDFNWFIDSYTNRFQPFFFYLSFPHVHTALFSSPRFQNTSFRGAFGDNLQEMAWIVGQVLLKLKQRFLDRQTLVLFLSDHGPHVESCELAGVTDLRGAKGNTWEGGYRIPAIAWWPGVIKPNAQSHAVLSALDLLPTVISLAGGRPPANLTLDGYNEASALLGFNSTSSHRNTIYYYCSASLMAVRYQDFKVHFYDMPYATDDDLELSCPGGIPLTEWMKVGSCDDSKITANHPPKVFNLLRDPYETYPLNVTLPHLRALLQAVVEVVQRHTTSLLQKPAKPLMGYVNETVRPCCQYPTCRCNYP